MHDGVKSLKQDYQVSGLMILFQQQRSQDQNIKGKNWHQVT